MCISEGIESHSSSTLSEGFFPPLTVHNHARAAAPG